MTAYRAERFDYRERGLGSGLGGVAAGANDDINNEDRYMLRRASISLRHYTR